MTKLGDDASIEEIFILFLALIPLLNAPLDWLSLGISRGLLGAIASRLHTGLTALLWALADFILALVFLVLVSLVTVAGIALANRMAMEGGGIEMVELNAVLNGIAANPGDPSHLWIYFMILTTLIPTLIHLVVASIAFTLWLGHFKPVAKWRRRVAGGLDDDMDARLGASLYLTAVTVIGLAMPMMAIFLAWTGASKLLDLHALAWFVEWLKDVAGWVNPGAALDRAINSSALNWPQ